METFENILSNQNDYMFQCDRKVLKSSFYFQHRNLACFDVGSKAPVHLPFKGAFTYEECSSMLRKEESCNS